MKSYEYKGYAEIYISSPCFTGVVKKGDIISLTDIVRDELGGVNLVETKSQVKVVKPEPEKVQMEVNE